MNQVKPTARLQMKMLSVVIRAVEWADLANVERVDSACKQGKLVRIRRVRK